MLPETVSLMQELCIKSGRSAYRKRLFLVWKLATKGVIPICHLRGALLVDDHDRSNFVRHNEVNKALIDEVAKFEKSLPPAPPQHPLIAALNKARQHLLQEAGS